MRQIKKNLEKFISGKRTVFLFSGDKGSTLLMNVVKDINVNIIFIDTGYQFNEIIDYVKSYGSKIEVIKNSNASIDYIVDMDECCHQRKAKVLKEYLSNTNAESLIVPFRDEERDNGIELSYLNDIDNIKVIRPLANLTERNIWIKIKENKLSFSAIYNKGYKIVDCKCCMTRHGRKKREGVDGTEELDKETEEKLKSLGYM